MATFTKDQQHIHREAFIKDCRQKAWSASCHADWVSKGLDSVVVSYQKLHDEDRALEAEIKTLELAVDYHTVENRNKRKVLQGRRNEIAKVAGSIATDMQQGQKALNNLYQSIEASLQLAEHAEKWEWKEMEAATEPKNN